MQDDSGFVRPDQPADGFVPLPSADKNKTRPPTQAGGPDNESVNVIDLLTADEQKTIAESVALDFEADVKSRAPRMKKIKEFTELYAGLLRPKSFPFQRCANVNLNVLSYTSLQVHARLFDMIWPDNGKVIYSAPATIEDFARAEATETFANSRIRNNMPEMAQGLDDTLAQLVVYGSAFRRTFWDTYEDRERSDWIPIEDFVVAHQYRSQDPSMRDVPRYTMVSHPTMWELQMYGDRGVYRNVDKIEADDAATTENSELKDLTNRIDGTTPTSEGTDEDKTRMVLEQHRIWRMPNRSAKHPSFDGKPHYVIAVVEKKSRKLISFLLREEDDPRDAKRFAQETAEFERAKLIAESIAQAAAQGMPVPETPKPVEPKAIRKRQVPFFTHYRAFPSEGFYGLGFGDFIGPLNKAANTLINQHIDGVTMRNARPGFISRQMKMQRGAVQVQPGEMIEVDAPIAAIKDGVTFLDPPLNDPTTMPLIKLLVEMADKFSGSSDIMSGSTSGANRTAKEIQVLNAQLMKQISVLAKRVREAQKHEFDKLWRLWGTFLPDQPEDMDVIDPLTGAPKRLPISRSMFVPDARVFPAADPRMRFEKVEEANQNFAMVMQNPMLAQNPMAVRAVTEEVLKANNMERLIAFLPPMQPQGPPPPRPHWEEEADWLREKDSPVNPQDDDSQHVAMHMTFLQSPAAQTMTKNGRDMAQRHVRFHEAQALEKKAKALQGPPVGPPQGPPMGQPPMMGGMGAAA